VTFVRRAFAWLLRRYRGAEQPSENQHDGDAFLRGDEINSGAAGPVAVLTMTCRRFDDDLPPF
jgi:hypothetical protein